MPDTVHDHARGQRIVRMQHRLRQLQPAGIVRRKRCGIKRLEETARHGLGRLLVVATNEKRPVDRLGLDDARRSLWHRHFGL